MDDSYRLFLSLAAIALCAIVGIYYIWVRKLGKSGDNAGQAQPKPQQQHPHA